MFLPEPLLSAIQRECASASRTSLAAGQKTLTDKYRLRTDSLARTTPSEKRSYLLSRMPATYGVVRNVLHRLKESFSLDSDSLLSILDVGAGPGTLFWALLEETNTPFLLTALEQDPEWISLGKTLISHLPQKQQQEVIWKQTNCTNELPQSKFDLVVCSYSLNEIQHTLQQSLLLRLWECTQQAMIVIEPGTPEGFRNVHQVRELLLACGGFLVAPCPHALQCPMHALPGRWCHFSQRIARTSEHRAIKHASLGYEDEKFSYIICAKTPSPLPDARLIGDPQHRSGHSILPLCSQGKLVEKTFSKKQGQLFKEARKKEWGDPLT